MGADQSGNAGRAGKVRLPLRFGRAESLARAAPRLSTGPKPQPRWLEKLAFHALETTGRIQQRLSQEHVRVLRNVPYLGSGRRSHLLDVYIPEGKRGPLPVVVYVHGGAFVWCSKETHFSMGQIYARAGFVVFNINYRLAPRHMFPSAMEDVCAALHWVHDNAARFGGDPTRLILAGESAGANLALGLTIACCSPRHEPWARALFDAGVTPRAVVAACGILHVTQASRIGMRKELHPVVRKVLRLLPDSYVDLRKPRAQGELDWVDPVRVFESSYRFARPLPGIFLPVGTRDPLLDDTRRMAEALAARGVPHEARYYAGEVHAFHFMTWRAAAQRCWQETFRFIDKQLLAPLPVSPSAPRAPAEAERALLSTHWLPNKTPGPAS
jgi:acetyl esterase